MVEAVFSEDLCWLTVKSYTRKPCSHFELWKPSLYLLELILYTWSAQNPRYPPINGNYYILKKNIIIEETSKFSLSFSQKSNKWINDENSVSFFCSQEEGAIKSHNCILIYKSGTEGDEHNTPDSHFIGLTTKMLKVKRLEEITTCYNSNGLEKATFFQCMEKVEKMKCFLGESSSEQDSRSGNNEVIVC